MIHENSTREWSHMSLAFINGKLRCGVVNGVMMMITKYIKKLYGVRIRQGEGVLCE